MVLRESFFTLDYCEVQFFALDNLAMQPANHEQNLGRAVLILNCEVWLNSRALATCAYDKAVTLARYSTAIH